MYVKIFQGDNNAKLFGNYNHIDVKQTNTRDECALDTMHFILGDSNEGADCFDVVGYKENGDRDFIRAQGRIYILNDNGKTMDSYSLAIRN